MKDNQASIADCPEWVKSECYRVVALASKGDFTAAYAAARMVAATPLPKGRPASAGSRILLWEAKTLPSRILLHRGLRGNANEAIQALPKPGDVGNTRDKSLAYWWIDGLRLALEARRLMDVDDFDQARDVVQALSHHGEMMVGTQAAAKASGERSAWIRAFRALEVLASELRGRMATAGPEERRGVAYNWFAAATDRQYPSSMMFPPALLTPMAVRLGEYYLSVEKTAEAIEAYERALISFPNDIDALAGLMAAYFQAGLTEQAAATEEKIRQLRAQ
jgi:tetratricopeptide (TPR) repeat protein